MSPPNFSEFQKLKYSFARYILTLVVFLKTPLNARGLLLICKCPLTVRAFCLFVKAPFNARAFVSRKEDDMTMMLKRKRVPCEGAKEHFIGGCLLFEYLTYLLSVT